MTEEKRTQLYKFKSIDAKHIIGTRKDPKNDFFSKFIIPHYNIKKREKND